MGGTSLSGSIRELIFDYNIFRSERRQVSHFTSSLCLAIQCLEFLGFLSITSQTHAEPISLAIQNFLQLFNLPLLLIRFDIPVLAFVYGSIALSIIFILLNMSYTIIKHLRGQSYPWLIFAKTKIDPCTFYTDLIYIPLLQLGGFSIFNPCMDGDSSQQYCFHLGRIGGMFLVALAVLIHCWLLFITLSCTYNINSRITGISNTVSVFFTLVQTLISNSSLHHFAIYGVFGAQIIVDVVSLFLNNYFVDTSMNRNYILWKGAQINCFFILLIPRIADDTWSYNPLAILFYPFIVKLLLSIMETRYAILQKKIVTDLANEVPVRSVLVDSFLCEFYFKYSNLKHYSHKFSDVLFPITEYVLTFNSELEFREKNEILIEDLDNITAESVVIKEIFRRRVHEYVINIYSKCLQLRKRNSRNDIDFGIYFSYLNFLKDVTHNYGKALIILAEIQKSLQARGSYRVKLQAELLENLLQQKVTNRNSQNVISAKVLFSFLDDANEAQLAVETHIANLFGFFGLTQRQMIRIQEIKDLGIQLMKERAEVFKKLNNLIRINELHQQTVLLYNFFLAEVVEEKAEGRFFQIQNRFDIYNINNYVRRSPNEGLVGLDMEFFSNNLHIGSEYFALILSLNPECVGKVLKGSTNFATILGINEKELKSLNVNTLELTIFDSHNINLIQERILAGEDCLKKLTEKERTLYFQTKKGTICMFSFEPDVQIYMSNPSIVCYMKIRKDSGEKFIMFDVNEGRMIGLGEGLVSLFEENNCNLDQIKNFSIYSMIPEVKSALNEQSKVDLVRAMFYPPTIKQKTSRKKTYYPRSCYSIDCEAEIRHLSLTKGSIGLIWVHSFRKTNRGVAREVLPLHGWSSDVYKKHNDSRDPMKLGSLNHLNETPSRLGRADSGIQRSQNKTTKIQTEEDMVDLSENTDVNMAQFDSIKKNNLKSSLTKKINPHYEIN